ncbi:putative UPF0481 protein [Tanacetum coccineum]|uniref:UPF0481 protein n=1 Tax=Tanacetum coccineum TaxID=301880 RepID=A0ABQ5F7U0_9ASTR
MASINWFLGLNSGDKQWVNQISKTLKTQLAFTVDTLPVSIFEVPKSRKEEKPEAYAPQRTGLGPLYHFKHELYQKMERNKLLAAQSLLKPTPISDSEDQVVKKVKEIIPIISTCYDFYLDRDDDSLAWLFAIDGLFLLHQLNAYLINGDAIEAKDLFMLENQIPFIVLKEIQNALLVNVDHSDEDHLENMFQSFCKYHSPFHITKEEVRFNQVNHLLDYMYHSIVNNEDCDERKFGIQSTESGSAQNYPMQDLLEAIKKLAEKIPGAEPFIKIINSVPNKNSEGSDNDKPKVEEIDVPSVSELHDIANTLMAKNSLLPKFRLELTEYVDFMCGIIDTIEDVMLLRKENIIVSEMDDEEIVKLFNGAKRMAENQVRASAKAIKFLVSISSTLIVIRETHELPEKLDDRDGGVGSDEHEAVERQVSSETAHFFFGADPTSLTFNEAIFISARDDHPRYLASDVVHMAFRSVNWHKVYQATIRKSANTQAKSTSGGALASEEPESPTRTNASQLKTKHYILKRMRDLRLQGIATRLSYCSEDMDEEMQMEPRPGFSRSLQGDPLLAAHLQETKRTWRTMSLRLAPIIQRGAMNEVPRPNQQSNVLGFNGSNIHNGGSNSWEN